MFINNNWDANMEDVVLVIAVAFVTVSIVTAATTCSARFGTTRA
jgi:hypothetical protein